MRLFLFVCASCAMAATVLHNESILNTIPIPAYDQQQFHGTPR